MSTELANIVDAPVVLNEEKVQFLEKHMLENMEQTPLPVTHSFGPNLYIREVFMPSGTFAIGHRQKTTHFNVMLKGKVLYFNEDGTKTILEAPLSYTSPPGRKIGYVLEDMVWQNIYSTNETDVEKLEETYLDKTQYSVEHRKKELLLRCDNISEDEEDFKQMLKDLGVTEELVKEQSEKEDDMTGLPLGSYKFQVGPSNIHGKGVFATSDILEGELVGVARLGDKRTVLGRYTNHAKNPNAKMVLHTNGDMYLIMTKSVSGCRGGDLGDEITIDYRQSYKLAMEKHSCQQQLPQQQ